MHKINTSYQFIPSEKMIYFANCFVVVVVVVVVVQYYQRPIPRGAQDIGTWQSIFTIMSVVAVMTNAGLICFTMDVLDSFSPWGKLWYDMPVLFIHSFILVLNSRIHSFLLQTGFSLAFSGP